MAEWMLILLALGQVAEDKPRPDAVQAVLSKVKERALAQADEDRRRALLVLQQAQTAREAGRLDEALKLARRARDLFPGSAEIRDLEQDILLEQRDRRKQAIRRQLAVDALAEAVERVRVLVQSRRLGEAKELAEAARAVAGRFPPDLDVKSARQELGKLLEEMVTLKDEPLPELPVEIKPRETLSHAAVKQAFNRTMSVDWRDEPLVNVLADISRHTGVTILIDPALERLRLQVSRKVDLRLHNTRAERLLRLVTELTETGYVVVEGRVVVTTKEKAVRHTVALSQGQSGTSLQRLMFPELSPGKEAKAEPLVEPALERLVTVPEHLQSGAAFTRHIEDLLGPAALRVLPPE